MTPRRRRGRSRGGPRARSGDDAAQPAGKMSASVIRTVKANAQHRRDVQGRLSPRPMIGIDTLSRDPPRPGSVKQAIVQASTPSASASRASRINLGAASGAESNSVSMVSVPRASVHCTDLGARRGDGGVFLAAPCNEAGAVEHRDDHVRTCIGIPGCVSFHRNSSPPRGRGNATGTISTLRTGPPAA